MKAEWTWDGRFFRSTEDEYEVEVERVPDRFCAGYYYKLEARFGDQVLERDGGYWTRSEAETRCTSLLEHYLELEDVCHAC